MPITDPTWIFFVVLSIILFAPMILERLHIPAIVGMILAGTLVGPHGFHLLERDGSFELFGKVGLYYIMFLAALEMNLSDVRTTGRQAGTLGILSFLLPMFIGTAANLWLLHVSLPAAILMAAMYASHTLISYPIVLRFGISRHRSVSIAVGGTIVADVLTLLVLAVVSGMFKEQGTGWFWVWLVLKVVLIGGFIVAAFPWMGRRFFRRYDEGVAQFIFVLGIVFLGAGLMEFVGMEGILGAFLAGLTLNRLIPPTSPLMSRIEFVGNALFIPYFLIGVGMLIDLRAFALHPTLPLIALVMIVAATLGKWLAAALTCHHFGLGRLDRLLLFGLTNSRAAATLAIVLVGYRIILPDGSRLFGEDIVAGAMTLILASCIISTLCTERAAGRLVLSGAEAAHSDTQGPGGMVVAISNPDTYKQLLTTALLLRAPGSAQPLTALNVVLEDNARHREGGLQRLEYAGRLAATTGVKLQTRSRWSVNVVSGITHTLLETEATDLLIGLHLRRDPSDSFWGRTTTDLLRATTRQVLIYRPGSIPLNCIRRLHLLIPRKAEFEPGFRLWAERIALLAEALSARVEAYGGKGTLAALNNVWTAAHHSLLTEWHEYRSWHDLLPLADRARQDHLVVFVSARRGTMSRHHYLDHLPDQIERYFSRNSLLVVYPSQPAATPNKATSGRSGLPITSG